MALHGKMVKFKLPYPNVRSPNSPNWSWYHVHDSQKLQKSLSPRCKQAQQWFDSLSGTTQTIWSNTSFDALYRSESLSLWCYCSLSSQCLVWNRGTKTPLNFDTYDNIFVQVVGSKYLRLYGKNETKHLYVLKNQKDALSYGKQGNISPLACYV